uniref:5'-deoxynucleotidase n=1 Tax=Brassica campestris TaxID=3711 RepID=M4ETK7_BRACM
MRNVMIHHRVFFCCTKPLSILPSLSPPHLHLSYSAAAAAASSPNRAIHCMANDSPLSQPLTGGDGSVSVPPPSPASSAIDFLSLCSRLKTTPRAGWGKRDVKNPESIADHMYRMGLMALISSDIPGVNTDTCIKMAIVHDIAEAEEIAELWREYEANASPEAKVVKDFDKLELILQALEYEQEQGKDLEEFFESTAGKFQTDIGKAWALEIASRRRKQQ